MRMHIIQIVLEIEIVFEFLRIITVIRAFFITKFTAISGNITFTCFRDFCIFGCFNFDAIFFSTQTAIENKKQLFQNQNAKIYFDI